MFKVNRRTSADDWRAVMNWVSNLATAEDEWAIFRTQLTSGLLTETLLRVGNQVDAFKVKSINWSLSLSVDFSSETSHLCLCPSPAGDCGLLAFQDVYKDVRMHPPPRDKRKWLVVAGVTEHFSKCCFDPALPVSLVSSYNNTPVPQKEWLLFSLGLSIKYVFYCETFSSSNSVRSCRPPPAQRLLSNLNLSLLTLQSDQ